MDSNNNKNSQAAIQNAASQARAMAKYGGKIINNVLLLHPTGQSKPGDGVLWEGKCLLCNKDLESPVTIKQLKKRNPCPCQRPDALRRAEYNAMVGETFGMLTFEGLDGTADRHMMGIFRCACGGKVVRKRMEEVLNGRVTSCGCVQKAQQLENLAQAGKYTYLMGTNLKKIARVDTDVAKNNTSGYTGVWFDRIRERWRAQLTFQGHIYTTYHTFRASAIASRYEMKWIHEDFMAWWTALSTEEQNASNHEFHKEKAVRKSLFEAHVARFTEMEETYKAVHLIFVVPGIEDYTLYAYCGDQKLRYLDMRTLVFADDKYSPLRDPIWFREHLTLTGRTAAWDIKNKNPFASPYIPLEIIYEQGTIVTALPRGLESDLRYED